MNNNNLQVFTSKDFGKIRTIMKDNEVWFVGKDVAEALGYTKPRNAIATHIDEEDKKHAPIQGDLGGTQQMIIINESGLFSLTLSSKLPTAKKFKRWVTKDVLPKVKITNTTQSLITVDCASLVKVINNQIVVSSRQVAEHFGKEHRHVLENVRQILAAENSATNFYHKTTFVNRGKQYPMYLMNRDGFSLLVMGFTGKEALEWKIKYINAFNEMERKIKSNHTLPDFTNPVEAAIAWAKQYKEKEKYKKELEEAKPKAEFADAITQCKTNLPIGTFAKVVYEKTGVGRNRLFEWLRKRGLLMTIPSEYNKPTQKATEMGLFTTKEDKSNTNTIKVKVSITPKGQLYIYKMLKGYADYINLLKEKDVALLA